MGLELMLAILTMDLLSRSDRMYCTDNAAIKTRSMQGMYLKGLIFCLMGDEQHYVGHDLLAQHWARFRRSLAQPGAQPFPRLPTVAFQYHLASSLSSYFYLT
jgi:hypothetical protein